MDPVEDVFPIKHGIFRCYVSLPEGIFYDLYIYRHDLSIVLATTISLHLKL